MDPSKREFIRKAGGVASTVVGLGSLSNLNTTPVMENTRVDNFAYPSNTPTSQVPVDNTEERPYSNEEMKIFSQGHQHLQDKINNVQERVNQMNIVPCDLDIQALKSTSWTYKAYTQRRRNAERATVVQKLYAQIWKLQQAPFDMLDDFVKEIVGDVL